MNGTQPSDTANAQASSRATPLIEFAKIDLAPDPGNLGDNLLHFDTQGKDLTVTIPPLVDPSNGPAPGDSILLLVDGTEIEASRKLFPDDGTSPIDLILPEENHADPGRHSINYRIYFVAGGGNDLGPQGQQFIADYVAPGPDLSPPAFAFDPDEGLDPTKLNQDGDLEARVYGYTGAAIYDTILPLIDNTEGDGTELDHEPDPEQHIMMKYPAAMLDQLDGAVHEFGYRVVDRAGNISSDSDTVSMGVLLDGYIDPLAAPVLPEAATDSFIDDAEARDGVIVNVPANPDLDDTYEVILIWDGIEYERKSGPAGGNASLPFTVLYGTVYDRWQRVSNETDRRVPTDVSYRLELNGFRAGLSPPVTVDVNLFLPGGEDPDPTTPVHEKLAPPQLKSSSGEDNLIPVDELDKEATIFVPYQSDTTPAEDVFTIGDVITVNYGTTTPIEPNPLTAVPTKDVEITLPVVNITDGGPGTVTLNYTVTRSLAGGGSNIALSPDQLVEVGDVNDLPGGGQDLPEGSWLESEWSPLPGRENTIGAEEAIKGITIEIPHYPNKAVGDEIAVTLEIAANFAHVDGDLPVTGRTITKSLTVGPGDVGGVSSAVFRYREVMYFGQPPTMMHAHIKHTARALGSPTEVPSLEGLVLIDSRGIDPYPNEP